MFGYLLIKQCLFHAISIQSMNKYCLKKSLNASRPSEHPPVRGENVKTFRWDHRLQRLLFEDASTNSTILLIMQYTTLDYLPFVFAAVLSSSYYINKILLYYSCSL